MISMTENEGKIERADDVSSTTIARAYGRFFGWRSAHRPRRTIDQILLSAFGSISPAYLF
jgi:hypothetical protein